MAAALRVDRRERDAVAVGARRRQLRLEPGEQPLGARPVDGAHPDLAGREPWAEDIEKTGAVGERHGIAPSWRTMTLSGLTSRWISPVSCAAESATATCVAMA